MEHLRQLHRGPLVHRRLRDGRRRPRESAEGALCTVSPFQGAGAGSTGRSLCKKSEIYTSVWAFDGPFQAFSSSRSDWRCSRVTTTRPARSGQRLGAIFWACHFFTWLLIKILPSESGARNFLFGALCCITRACVACRGPSARCRVLLLCSCSCAVLVSSGALRATELGQASGGRRASRAGPRNQKQRKHNDVFNLEP